MKLISLNLWGGQLYKPLQSFLISHAHDTDIFCFQEMRNGEIDNVHEGDGEREDLFNEISVMLPDHTGYFAEQVRGVGSATFVKKDIEVEGDMSMQILTAEDLAHMKRPNGSGYYPRILQIVSLKNPAITVYNFHGIPGSGKKDTPERKLQTERLLEVLNKKEGLKILVGDFNLGMETQAVSEMENSMRNLVKEGGFATTRNSHYEDYMTVPFSDYAFVSKDIHVEHFEVLPDEVSDHLALMLIFKK